MGDILKGNIQNAILNMTSNISGMATNIAYQKGIAQSKEASEAAKKEAKETQAKQMELQQSQIDVQNKLGQSIDALTETQKQAKESREASEAAKKASIAQGQTLQNIVAPNFLNPSDFGSNRIVLNQNRPKRVVHDGVSDTMNYFNFAPKPTEGIAINADKMQTQMQKTADKISLKQAQKKTVKQTYDYLRGNMLGADEDAYDEYINRGGN